jgi:prepilin-type N-terminal cleavage/methylation domain-containing protein
MKHTRQNRAHRAFTLIELMVVVTIIGLLASIAIPSFKDYVLKAKKMERPMMHKHIATAMKAYIEANNRFPLPNGTSGTWVNSGWNPPDTSNPLKMTWQKASSGWTTIGVEPDGQLYYRYYVQGWLYNDGASTSYFTVYSYGDIDQNNLWSWRQDRYELQGGKFELTWVSEDTNDGPRTWQ